jgi:hypothetical protein
MLGELFKWWKSRSTNGPQTFKTIYGEFLQTNKGGEWYCPIIHGDSKLHCFVMDVEGQPYPKFIEQVSSILRQLPYLVKVAQNAVPQLNERFILDSIDADRRDYDFCLGFYLEESDSVTITISVNFQNGRVVNHVINRCESDIDDELKETKVAYSPRTGSPFETSTSNPWSSSSNNKVNNQNPWS